jgi:N-acetylglucosaminylphosphatidylinositol deacetylase
MQATNGILRKYILPLDLLVSLIASSLQQVLTNNTNDKTLCCIGGGPFAAWPALRAHQSQFVWFRKLFTLFSSYIYINTLIPVN